MNEMVWVSVEIWLLSIQHHYTHLSEIRQRPGHLNITKVSRMNLFTGFIFKSKGNLASPSQSEALKAIKPLALPKLVHVH